MTSPKPRIAAVGAGRMGRGLAHVFAYAGHDVALVDVKQRKPEDADRIVAESTREVAASLGLMAEFGAQTEAQRDAALARVTFVKSANAAAALADADFIFEGVPEVLEVKERAFDLICRAARDDAIITSTTSTMLVDTLAAFVTHPERFVNGHWLNPAFLIPLVEVSPGAATSKATVDAFKALLEAVGKVPVVCAASPGFIVPRIQSLAMSEAARMVEEGVASAEEIDRATRVGFGLRFAILGLVEFIDWGGVDILYYANRYLTGALGSDRFAAPEIANRLMEDGKIGPKTGEGFYDYGGMDFAAYQRETLRKFVDLLNHLALMPPPGGVPDGADGPAARTHKPLKPATLTKR